MKSQMMNEMKFEKEKKSMEDMGICGEKEE